MSKSSAAFNLWKKLEWMSRRLRHIDDAAEIIHWIEAMNSIYGLVQLVAKNGIDYRDGWKPWSDQQKVQLSKRTSEHNNSEKMDITKQEMVFHCTKPDTPPAPSVDTDGLQVSLPTLREESMPTPRPSCADLAEWEGRLPSPDSHCAIDEPQTVCDSDSSVAVEQGSVGLKPVIGSTHPKVGHKRKRVSIPLNDISLELAKLKIKSEWRHALLRKLGTVREEKEHWGYVDSQRFTELLLECGRDTLLKKNLKDVDHSLVNRFELRKYLYSKLIEFYSIET